MAWSPSTLYGCCRSGIIIFQPLELGGGVILGLGIMVDFDGLPILGLPFCSGKPGSERPTGWNQNSIIWKKFCTTWISFTARENIQEVAEKYLPTLKKLPEVYMCSLRIRWSYFFLCLGKTWKVLSWYRFRWQELRFKFPSVSGTLEMMLTAFGYGNVEWPESGITKDPGAWKKLNAFHSCNFRMILVKYSMFHAEVTCFKELWRWNRKDCSFSWLQGNLGSWK